MAGVLEGIKVLDFTQVYSGPFCTLLLKDLGAEVIKVERPESGDLIRYDVPHTEGNEGGPFIILNRGKKSLTVDLKTEKGRNICKELVKKVDVLVENFSPGTMDKLGLGSKEMCKLNPKLIYASISAYGQTGPRRDYPGFDPVAQAMGGMTCVTGFPDNPTRCGVSIADFSSGIFTALSIVSALYHRLKTGEGQTIDISMQDCIWQLTSIEFAPYYFLNHEMPPRLGNGHCRHDSLQSLSHQRRRQGIHQCRRACPGAPTLYRHGPARPYQYAAGRQPERALPAPAEIDEVITAWTKTKTTQEIPGHFEKSRCPLHQIAVLRRGL